MTEDMRALFINTVNDNDATPTMTPHSESPGLMVTPPGISTFTMFPHRQRQDSELTITPVVARPVLKRHAYTAPLGSLQMFPGANPQFKPQTPRRAVSSTTAHAFSRSGSRNRRRPSRTLALTPIEMSKTGKPTSRLIVSTETSPRDEQGRTALKTRPLVWRMSSPPKAFELPPDVKPSFSGRDRVKETMKRKNMEMLKVDFGNSPPRERLLASASSIVNTPNVFYNRPASLETKTPPSPASSPGLLQAPASRSTTSLDTGTSRRSPSPSKNAWKSSPPSSLRSAASSKSDTLSTRSKHFSLPLSPGAQGVPWRRSMVIEVPPQSKSPAEKEERPIYIPGPIQLEENISVTPRCASVANLDDGDAPEAKRFSDLVVLDSITMYFEAFGVTEASDACLDRYWVRSTATHSQAVRKGKIASGAAPIPSPRSGSLATTLEGIFRGQKPSPDNDIAAPASGTAGRRKPLLRQLLKPSRKSS